MDPPNSFPSQPMDIPEFVIIEQDYPSELRGSQYDGLVICSKAAQNIAKHFKETVETRVRMEDGTVPKVALLSFERNGDFSWIGSKLNTLGEAIKRSTYYFCIMTPEFEQNCWDRISKEACLMESIESEDKEWSVIPLTTTEESPFRFPIGLRALRPLCMSALFDDGNIIGDVSCLSQVDMRCFITDITRILNDRKHQRQARERKQQELREAWKRNEISKLTNAFIRSRLHEQTEQRRLESEKTSLVSSGMADMNITQAKTRQPSPGTRAASGGVLSTSGLHTDGGGLTINVHCAQAQVGSNNTIILSPQHPPDVDQSQAAEREERDSEEYMVCETGAPVEESSTQDRNTAPDSHQEHMNGTF